MQGTVINYLIGCSVVCTAGAVITVASCNITGVNHDSAQKNAETFLKEMGVEGVAVCAGVDSDGDGYVSCPYWIKGKDQILPLECATIGFNSGCRVPKMALQSR